MFRIWRIGRVNRTDSLQKAHFVKSLAPAMMSAVPPLLDQDSTHTGSGAAFSLAVWNLSLGTLVANSLAPPPRAGQIIGTGPRTVAKQACRSPTPLNKRPALNSPPVSLGLEFIHPSHEGQTPISRLPTGVDKDTRARSGTARGIVSARLHGIA